MIARLLIGLIRLYQLLVSPWLRPSCRFFPSCSQYMIDAIMLHGPLRGPWLGAKRVLRCQPLCKGGFDFVPPPRNRRMHRSRQVSPCASGATFRSGSEA